MPKDVINWVAAVVSGLAPDSAVHCNQERHVDDLFFISWDSTCRDPLVELLLPAGMVCTLVRRFFTFVFALQSGDQ